MDLGLGGFLEKFEDHFGRGWAKFMLVVVGVTVVTFCAVTVWSLFLRPMAAFLADVLPSPDRIGHPRVWKLGFFVAYFLFLVNLLVSIADTYLKRRDRRVLKADIKTARALNDEGKRYLAEAQQLSNQAGEVLAAAGLALEHVLSAALENNWLTSEQVDQLRELAGEIVAKDAPAA